MVRDSRTARGGRQWPWALVSEEKTEGGCRGSMRDERHRQAAAAERRRRVAAMPASACRSVGSGQMESSVSSGSRRCRGVSPAAKAAAGSTTARVRGAGSCCGPAGGRWRTQQRRATALRTLFAIGVGLVMHARGATGYLIKAHMHWERVGAFPHYLTTPPEEKDASKEWPRSTLCYNGPSCAKHMPDYACNSDCGNPNIGIKDDTGQNYPKDDMIRFVIDLVVDSSLWQKWQKNRPTIGQKTQLGTFCRDISLPLDYPDNCVTNLPFLVMNITSEGQFGLSNNPSGGYAYLQHASQWDYSLNPDTNDGLGMSGTQEDSNNVLYEKLEGQENAPPFPKRLTIGYNFSSGLRGFAAEAQPMSPEYPRCSEGLSTTSQIDNPSCYCLTATCEEDDVASPARFIGENEWTITSDVTFDSDDKTFNMGVTPNTQHHSPRIFGPTILHLPLIHPLSMGTSNHSFNALAAADEDGATTVTWETGTGSVLTISSDGVMNMPALATKAEEDKPWVDVEKGWFNQQPLLLEKKLNRWNNWWLWKVRLNVIDNATFTGGSPVTSSLLMTAKLCWGGGKVAIGGQTGEIYGAYVPHTVTSTGIEIKMLGDTQPIYIKDWGPSCVDNNGKRLHNNSTECSSAGGTWQPGPHFYTAPETHVECIVDQPCQFEVVAVRLDFVKDQVKSCIWSDQPNPGQARFCHDLTKENVAVKHDGFAVSSTGEHQHSENSGTNPGRLVVSPFRGRGNTADGLSRVNPYPFDIGRQEVFCITATSDDMSETLDAPCPSLPHCVTVVVKGRQPVVTSPKSSATCGHRTKPDASEYLSGECPDLYACWNSDSVSEVTLSAEDEDIGETVTIAVDSISTYTRYADSLHHVTEIAYPQILGTTDGGVDVNDHCRLRAKDPNEDPPTRKISSVPPLATVLAWGEHHCGSVIRKFTFRNDYVNESAFGFSPLETKISGLGHRYTAMRNDSMICYTVSDNQAEVWGRGINNKYSRCHVLRLRGAPVFEYSPLYPLDTPFGFPSDQNDIGFSETTLNARLSEEISFSFRARDPNPEDPVKIMFLQDPGLPNEAKLGEQVCVDYGSVDNFFSDGTHTIPRTYTQCDHGFCNTVSSPCNEAHRTFSWTPTPSAEGSTFKVCAIAKDSKTECGAVHTRRPDECPVEPSLQFKDTCVIPSTVGASKRSTMTGFYGSQHCVNIFVTAPQPRWDAGTVPTEAGVNKLAHVGCDIVWKVSATDLNNYTMVVEVDPETPLPVGGEMSTVISGVTTHKEFHWTPTRGMEGSQYTICWLAWSAITYPTQLSEIDLRARLRNTDGTTQLPTRCAHVRVRRCKYCVQGEETLLVKMKQISVDMNWLRLWAANGNEDGDHLTEDVTDPGLLGTGMLDGVANGQLLNIGPIYKFQTGDSMMAVAGRFRTTVRSLLDLNPDILDPATVRPGQEICFVPCTVHELTEEIL